MTNNTDQQSVSLKVRISRNWKSGLTVALISLPLSIALSIASGAGPVPGIVTGFWATLVASFFGSSNYNIIGAAGALTTILFGAAAYDLGGQGGPWVLPFLAIGTGLFILVVWLLKFDRYLRYIPTSVMYGFATGVALLIASNQLFDALGLSNVERHGHFLLDVKELFVHAGDISIPAAIIFTVFLSALIIWKRYVKSIPGIIPIAAVGTIFGLLIKFVPAFSLSVITLVDRYGDAAGAIPISLVAFPDFATALTIFGTGDSLVWFIRTALVIALIAILETLITARLADVMTGDKTNSGTELRGLGFANIASGIFGGLPATGVFIRTGANIRAGATHKTSQTVAALCAGVLAFAFLPFFKYVPMAVVAAILFNTALGLIELHHFKRYWSEERKSFIVGFAVALTTVIEDAGFGVIVGTLLALLFFIDQITRGKFEMIFNSNKVIVSESRGEFIIPAHPVDDVVYSISGFLGYIDAPTHASHIEQLADMKSVASIIIRMRNLHYIDLDGVDAIAGAVDYAQKKGKFVLFASVNDLTKERLSEKSIFKKMIMEGKFYPKTEAALQAAGFEEHHLGKSAFTTVVEE